MLDSINRAGQASIDWSQLTNIKKSTNSGYETSVTQNQTSKYDATSLNKEVEKVNTQLAAMNHSLRMKFSEEAEQFYVEVIDVRTHEVLDSIPGKHMIDLAAKLKDMIGFFIDEKR